MTVILGCIVCGWSPVGEPDPVLAAAAHKTIRGLCPGSCTPKGRS